MRILTRYAKAWIALAVSAGWPPLFLAILGGSAAHILGAAMISLPGAVITAVAVYLVANRVDGFNVDDMAQAVIDAAEEVAAEFHGGDNDAES